MTILEKMPGVAQSVPPPPPSRRSRKGLWLGLAIGVVVLCPCCIVIGIGIYLFGQNILNISSFFPSPTPTGLFYSNPSAGISLTYPSTWQYSESGDAANGYTIIFASSEDILNNSTNAPQTGAAMAILTNVVTASDLSFTVDASSMGNVVEYIATTIYPGIRNDQDLRTFTLSGYPAASVVYTITSDTGSPSTAYFIGVLRNTEIIMFIGVCSQAEWSQQKSTFDSIINSVSIFTP